MKVSVIGLGYVGISSALVMSEAGIKIIGVDNDKDKINDLKNGKIKIYEPGLSAILQKSLKENIAMTKEVVKYAESAGVLVEAEIGKIMGRDVVIKSDADFLASVADVKAIVEEANPHILAVGIGTSHGFTPTTPKIMSRFYLAIAQTCFCGNFFEITRYHMNTFIAAR